MKKHYCYIFICITLSFTLLGCSGDEDEYDPDLSLTDLGNPSEGEQLFLQDVVYLFGDMFKQLLTTLEVSSSANNLGGESTTMGQLIKDSMEYADNDVASGISLVTSSPCSKSGNVEMRLHAEMEYGGTPGGIKDFLSKQIEFALSLNMDECMEWGRKPIIIDKENGEGRFDKSKQTELDGSFKMTFVSYPNISQDGFSLDAFIDLDNFLLSEQENDTPTREPIRLDGNIDLSLKTVEINDDESIKYLANIGAQYVSSHASEYTNISLDAVGTLGNDLTVYNPNPKVPGLLTFPLKLSLKKNTYDLEIKGLTGKNTSNGFGVYEYISLKNIIKETPSSDFYPDSGELMIVAPDGSRGYATICSSSDLI